MRTRRTSTLTKTTPTKTTLISATATPFSLAGRRRPSESFLLMPSPVPEKILRLARAVRGEGGRALLVGGCVRDRLMGRMAKDWDVEVYGVEPAVLRELLDRMGRVNVVGEAFTIYKLGRDLDVSLPRRERKAGRGHRAFIIEGDPSMMVEEAARGAAGRRAAA